MLAVSQTARHDASAATPDFSSRSSRPSHPDCRCTGTVRSAFESWVASVSSSASRSSASSPRRCSSSRASGGIRDRESAGSRLISTSPCYFDGRPHSRSECSSNGPMRSRAASIRRQNSRSSTADRPLLFDATCAAPGAAHRQARRGPAIYSVAVILARAGAASRGEFKEATRRCSARGLQCAGGGTEATSGVGSIRRRPVKSIRLHGATRIYP